VNLAGQPSKVGGTVARVFGWIVLAAGLGTAALLAGLIALLGGGEAALIVGGPIALITAIVAYALFRGGKELKKSGDVEEQATRQQAIYGLAGTRGGVLKAWDVAQALQMSPKEADDILTTMAKEQPDHVTVDVDDEGNVLYRFPAAHWRGVVHRATTPSMAPNAVPPHVRLRVPPPATRVAPPPVRVDAREPLEGEPAEDVEEEAARQKVHF